MSKRKSKERTGAGTSATLERAASSSWFAFFVLSAVAFLAYSNSFQNGFHFDDESSIVFNPVIRDLSSMQAIWKGTPTRFLTYLSFALNYRFGGLDVVGYHAINLLLHVLSGLVVWHLVRRILKSLEVGRKSLLRQAAPYLAALAFIAHPIQTQAVTYIAQRATVLATLLYLLAVYFFLAARQHQVEGSDRVKIVRSYAFAVAAGFLGLLSKETILTLPFALILVDASFSGTGKGINWRFFLSVLSVFVFFAVALVTLNLVSLEDAPAISQLHYMSTQPLVLLTYVRLLFLPYGQNLDYVFPISQSPFEWWVMASLAVLAVLLVVAIRLFNRERLVAFSIFWFVLVLLPESSILPLADVIFEHRLYLPMFGFSLFLIAMSFKLEQLIPPRFVYAVFAVVICVWISLTYERNKVWKDEISLWSDVIAKAPDNPRAYNNRGRALGDLGRFDEALADFNRTLALNPANSDAYNNRANILVQRGQLDEAIADCNRALALAPRMDYQVSRIYFNRGTALVRKNQLDPAIQDFNEAIRYEPNHESAHFNRGIAYAAKGEYGRAIDDYTFVLGANANNSRALNNRGIAYRQSGNLDSAIADFSAALRLQPSYGAALINRGLVWSLKGELGRAEEDLTRGISLMPDNADGLTARGSVYLRKGLPRQALSDFDKALTLKVGNVEASEGRKQALALLRNSNSK